MRNDLEDTLAASSRQGAKYAKVHEGKECFSQSRRGRSCGEVPLEEVFKKAHQYPVIARRRRRCATALNELPAKLLILRRPALAGARHGGVIPDHTQRAPDNAGTPV